MERQDLISADEICSHYQVEWSFIRELGEHDLIEINIVEQTEFIPAERLSDLERFIRLHHELEINLEGLEAVDHLLKQMEAMENRIRLLENKLQAYEA
jgi:hypothetical protein